MYYYYKHLLYNKFGILSLDLYYLVTDVSCELDEIVFDSYVPCPCDIFPPAAYMANFSD